MSNIEVAPDLGMLRLILGDLVHLRDIAMCAVDLLFKAFERLHHVADGARAEDARKDRNLSDAPARTRSDRRMLAERDKFRLPNSGVASLTRRNRFKCRAPLWILLERGEPVVEVDRVALKGESGEASGAILDLLHAPPSLASQRSAPMRES